jgi:arsenite methyltransferase
MSEVLELPVQPMKTTDVAAPAMNFLRNEGCSTARPSVFDRCWRQYALCREHLFTDHTPQIVSALQPLLTGPQPRSVVEAGCGPGFYSRRLAARFPQVQITGIDLSEPLLHRAREHARRSGLLNCSFLQADALSLADFPNQVDAVIASRLFLILADPALAMDAIFTTLRPGGICFIAEPTSRISASIPLFLMKASGSFGRRTGPVEQKHRSRILSMNDFEMLVESQPWRSIRIWKDRQYNCAVCKKAT